MDKNNNKKNDTSYLETAQEFTRLANNVGIMIHGCFMIGNLNETKDTLDQTLEFSKQLQIDKPFNHGLPWHLCLRRSRGTWFAT